MNAYLAIDLGAESGRTIVGVLDGGKLSLHETHRFMHLPCRLPAGLHWDLTGLWGQIVEGCRKSFEWADKNGATLCTLGVDTWGVDWCVLEESGDLLMLPRCYRDASHNPAFEKTVEAVGRESLWRETGIQFMWLNTLYQVVARCDAQPDMMKLADRFLFMPDLLHYFFTGKVVVESSIASTSQMTNPRTGGWAIEMLEKLRIPTDMLGEIVPPGTPLGPLRPELAGDLNAPENLQVIAPASHDTASAVAAVPTDEQSNWAYLSSGTWSLMGAELDEPCLSDAAREVPFTNESGVNGTIRFLKNIAGLWLVQECRRDFEKHGESLSYDQLTQLAREAEPFRTLVDTDHGSFVAPGGMPAKIADYASQTDQPVPETPGPFIRCCLESLALTYRHTLRRLEAVLDKKYDTLHIVGGGGKNTLLNQMTADALGIPVIVGPYEATAIGNILVQAMGHGDVNDLVHLRQIVRDSFEPQTYTPAQTDAWDKAYERFVGLIG